MLIVGIAALTILQAIATYFLIRAVLTERRSVINRPRRGFSGGRLAYHRLLDRRNLKVRFPPVTDVRNVSSSARAEMSGSGLGATVCFRPIADLALLPPLGRSVNGQPLGRRFLPRVNP